MPKLESKALNSDIRVFEPNLLGEDKIIGDVHGNSACLQAVIDTLGPHDRLFIVGDLTDRGNDNPGVMRLLRDNPDKVISIRGNHETLCLEAIEGLEQILYKKSDLLKNKNMTQDFLNASNNRSLLPELRKKYGGYGAKSVFTHAKNGGDWLITLFQKEFQEGKISIQKQDSGETVIVYAENSEVLMIKDIMENLPYIIHVEGDKPFHAVHADMPINDDELNKRINKGMGLSEDQKYYATWAREGINKSTPIVDCGRTKDSIPTFVGHNMIDEGNEPAFRASTNTYNLDVGTYSNDISLVVNVTKGEAEFIGIPPVFECYMYTVAEGHSLESKLPFLEKKSREHNVPLLINHNNQIYLYAAKIADPERKHELTRLGPMDKMGQMNEPFIFPKGGQAKRHTFRSTDFPENFPYSYLREKQLIQKTIINEHLLAAQQTINQQLSLIRSKKEIEATALNDLKAELNQAVTEIITRLKASIKIKKGTLLLSASANPKQTKIISIINDCNNFLAAVDQEKDIKSLLELASNFQPERRKFDFPNKDKWSKMYMELDSRPDHPSSYSKP